MTRKQDELRGYEESKETSASLKDTRRQQPAVLAELDPLLAEYHALNDNRRKIQQQSQSQPNAKKQGGMSDAERAAALDRQFKDFMNSLPDRLEKALQ